MNAIMSEPTGAFSERTYIYRAASTFPSPFQAPILVAL